MKHSKKTVFKSALDFETKQLAVCLEKIAEQKQLLRIVQSVLTADIAAHAEHCVQSGSRLLIYTDAAIWASQIRFFQQVILDNLRESGQKNIEKIQVKILPPISEQLSFRTARLPSPETIERMVVRSGREGEDVLDDALSRLAKTLRKRTEGKAG